MKASDDRRTPARVFEQLNRLFNFTLDPCTAPENPLGTPSFYTIESDGLASTWQGHKAFVNPPYSAMLKWAKKAIEEANDLTFVAFILPNDCSTEAWQILAAASWGRWNIPYRVKFFDPAKQKVVDVARSHVVFLLGGLP